MNFFRTTYISHSLSPKSTKVQLIKREVNKRAFLMRDISSKILSTDNIPAIPLPSIQLLLDNSCNFAVFLGLGHSRQVSYLLNCRVGNADDIALFLGTHIRHPNQYFFVGFLGLVLVLDFFAFFLLILLVFSLICHW